MPRLVSSQAYHLAQITPLPSNVVSSQFALPSYEQWVAAAKAAAKVDSLEALSTSSLEGLLLDPIYTPKTSPDADAVGMPGALPYVRGVTAAATTAQGWQIRSTVGLTTAADVEIAVSEIAGGVDALNLRQEFRPDLLSALISALLETSSELPPVYLQAGDSLEAAGMFVEALESAGVDIAAMTGSFGFDPIGAALASQAHMAHGEEHERKYLTERLATAANFSAKHTASSNASSDSNLGSGLRTVSLDGTAFAEAGAGDIAELGALLANATSWLRSFDLEALPVEHAATQMEFTISASADVFAVIAKCRALRRCWSAVLEACGCAEATSAMSLHVSASSTTMRQADPWINVLRSTTAGLAASLGGANAITLPSFAEPSLAAENPGQDSTGQDNSGLGRRIARNTQLILRHESKTNAVIDPAGGSWYVEELTEQLAEHAWQYFTQIEASGGLVEVLLDRSDNGLRASLAETAELRSQAIATGQQVLVGASQFTQPDEKAPNTKTPGQEEPQS